MTRLLWRVRYTIYGQRTTGWGWGLWWEWSDSAAHDYFDDKYGFADHEDAVNEAIYDALILSACEGHGQDNKQGTSVVGQEHQQQEQSR